ncbi:hypothetical protein QBC34DRAFT_374019 [Podospora aff. communis PSN243]|uniref:LIM zinc-binding domain-containing protein n=1 Tax=Podospora aff. communis PSN243 TaxID=3040156 RepID=A0AAV9H867_9PEZI|nr:hypothetical protein QBC34DRAFT_374019 [Podospora aff. communis PSN243]
METLQTPKTGRSRFSKALPAPPSFLERKLSKSNKSSLPALPPSLPLLPPQLPPLSIGLPSSPAPSYAASRLDSPKPSLASEKLLPPIKTGPPLPPPKKLVREASSMAAAASSPRPLDSPLPPLPKKVGGLPSMAIPRRPVPAPAPAPAPVAIQVPAPAPALSTAEPSPVGSFSSLLSAYSNHTTETTPRSSTNSTNGLSSAKESYSTVSPGEQVKVGSARSEGPVTDFSGVSPIRDAPEQELGGVQATAEEKKELPPPPPLKDILHRSHTPPVEKKPVGQSPVATQSPSTLVNSASPQPEQLWRRRSVRSDKNIAVPELKLAISHGSTAASTQNQPQPETNNPSPQPVESLSQEPAEAASPAAKSRLPLPRGAHAALPGRNIRPVASRQQIAAPEQATMGQKASNLVHDVTGRSPRNGSPVRPSEKAALLTPRPAPAAVKPMKSMPNIAPPHSVVRLPTPEYDSNDVKNPLVETVVSPVSPASSPDLPTESQASVTRKPVGEVASQVRHAKSTPTLLPKATTPTSPARSPGLPLSPAANRAPGQFPARTTSRLGEEYRPSPITSPREPAGPVNPFPKQRDQQPRPTPSGTRTISENGSTASDETVKPKFPAPGVVHINGDAPLDTQPDAAETEEPDMTDHPGAALFPRNWYTPLPANEVMEARPLETKHFRCLTQHRYMTAARQKVNPIACRTCGTKEWHAECYICSACHLNICPGCNIRLRRLRGDLEQVLQQIKDEAEGKDKPEPAKETPRPDSDTFAVPPTDPPLTFVIEAQ